MNSFSEINKQWYLKYRVLFDYNNERASWYFSQYWVNRVIKNPLLTGLWKNWYVILGDVWFYYMMYICHRVLKSCQTTFRVSLTDCKFGICYSWSKYRISIFIDAMVIVVIELCQRFFSSNKSTYYDPNNGSNFSSSLV